MIVKYKSDVFPGDNSPASKSLGRCWGGNIYLYNDFEEEFGLRANFIEAVALLHETIHLLLGHKDSDLETDDPNEDSWRYEKIVWRKTASILGRAQTIKIMKEMKINKLLINYMKQLNQRRFV